MADKKISALTAATLPLAGTEVLPIVQGGATVKVATLDITGGIPVGKGLASVATNTAVGINALVTNTTGARNVAVGDGALKVNTDGFDNTAVGSGAMIKLTTNGLRSTAVGSSAFANATGMQYGTAVGTFALSAVVDGQRNTALGYAAGNTLNNGSGCIFIGYLPQPLGISDDNEIVIGQSITGNGSNTTTIGNASTTGTYLPNGNLIFKTAAKGINFTANTPAAGMTSQLLNWYEEGTWTPNQGAGLTVVGAFTSNGTYVRIGRSVTVKGQILGATTVAVSATGVMTSNLPFTAASGHAGSMYDATIAVGGVVGVTGTSVTAATAIAASASITFTVTYQV